MRCIRGKEEKINRDIENVLLEAGNFVSSPRLKIWDLIQSQVICRTAAKFPILAHIKN